MMMLKIDISFRHNGELFAFKVEIEEGGRHIIEVGERMLADKLFFVLCGLDKEFDGVMKGADWSHTKANNILALGDSSMFLKGSVQKNIYKALRTRMKRAEAKQKTQEVINIYNIDESSTLMNIALARAHFRDIKLIVANCFETFVEKNFTTPTAPFIIEIH